MRMSKRKEKGMFLRHNNDLKALFNRGGGRRVIYHRENCLQPEKEVIAANPSRRAPLNQNSLN